MTDNTDILLPARFIRERVFGVPTQKEFAELLGVKQASISRWETGENGPSKAAIARMKALAERRRIKWDYKWVFEVPNTNRRPS